VPLEIIWVQLDIYCILTDPVAGMGLNGIDV